MRSEMSRLLTLACALLALCFACACGQEKTYTESLVKGARAAQDMDSRQKLEIIGGALERYAMDHGGYPEAMSLEEIEPLLTPIYVHLLPQHDGWGRPWRLRSGYDGFVLSSDGPDGTPDTQDDLKRESGSRVSAPAL
ncbi:MAG: type II secretion system protein GspG [Acidobacteriota bacterium]